MNNPFYSNHLAPSVDSQISGLTEQLNRQTSHLDTLANSVTISLNGKIDLTYDAATKTYPVVSIPVSTSTNNGFIAYMKRSDQPARIYSLPYFDVSVVSNTILLAGTFVADTGQLSARAQITTTHPAPPATLTFYYFLIQQPVDQVSS